MKLKALLVLLLLVAFRTSGSVPVERLQDAWMVFDNSYKSYVPYIANGETPRVLYYTLKPGRFQYDTLRFFSNKGLCLFVDSRLVYQNNDEGNHVVKISLQKLIGNTVADSAILAFYRPEGINTNLLNAEITTQGTLLDDEKKGSFVMDLYNPKQRKADPWEAILLFSVIGVITLLMVSKMIFPEGASFWQLIGMNFLFSTASGTGGFWNGILMVKIIINSLCISTFTYFILNSEWGGQLPVWGAGVREHHVSYWSIMFWVLLIHFIKFVYNYVCANLGNMSHLLQGQNFLFVNIFYVFNLLLLAFLILCNSSALLSEWLVLRSPQIVVFYFVVPVLVLIINIIKLSGFRNVYLFSYICTVEVLPLVVVLRFLV